MADPTIRALLNEVSDKISSIQTDVTDLRTAMYGSCEVRGVMTRLDRIEIEQATTAKQSRIRKANWFQVFLLVLAAILGILIGACM